MQSFTYLIIAIAALLQGAVAVPAITSSSSSSSFIPSYSLTSSYPSYTSSISCAAMTTVTTTNLPRFHCDIVCPTPTRQCQPGESSLSLQATTTTPPGCTAWVTVNRPPCACPTCTGP
ncbi:hypothetical protein F5Y05DRAFT_288064 [Hypoxylon sp. FL0543]|nr:hypothetical protein F5Y05DRAFT_288064 [Hypoxylon sp. FL0543]